MPMACALLTVLFAFGNPDAKLADLLRQYFLAADDAARSPLADQIVKLPGLDRKKLAGAIRDLSLWEKQRTGRYDVHLRLGADASSEKQVFLSVPANCDPARKWPLILSFHGTNGQSRQMLAMTMDLLGERAAEFIVAAPQDIGPLGLTSPPGQIAQIQELLLTLRKRFHLDNDRVYVMGYSLGSHHTWLSSVIYPDAFAGAIPLATPLQLIGGDALFDTLLPNARQIAILFCWGQKDTLDPQGKPDPDGGNAELNRRMSKVIRASDFRNFTAVELPGVGHMGVLPPPDAFGTILNEKRVHTTKEIHHAFRLPIQSRAFWVEAEELQGDPLPDQTVKIHFAPGQDPIAAQKRYLTERLGVIEAKCEGQTITLRGRKTKGLVLYLDDELLDLDKPVKIVRTGKTRFEGRINPDLRVMLHEAARTWDFDRLVSARVVIPLFGKVRFGVDDRRSSHEKK